MLTSGDSEGHKMCEALWEKPAQETKNPSCARKRPSNQEQTDFPKFQLFVILTSLSANISQNYVWKMLFIEQLLSHKLLFNQHAVLAQIHILETSCLGGENPDSTHLGVQPGQSASEIYPLSDVGNCPLSLWQ